VKSRIPSGPITADCVVIDPIACGKEMLQWVTAFYWEEAASS
jgi:hypothetical protein